MDYHIFKKPKIKNGKKNYKWYAYYTQISQHIQKICKIAIIDSDIVDIVQRFCYNIPFNEEALT